MYRTILVPTDGSDEAARGVEHGLDIAAKYDATVHTLFVVDESYGMTPALGSFELALEAWEDRGRVALDAVVEAGAEAGVTVEPHCLRGYPYETIVRFAADNDVDLIVMGRQGAGGIERPHIGSVTDRVMRLSDVPVLPV